MSDDNPLSVDVSDDVIKLLDGGPRGPQTWRDSHKLVDLGGGRPYALVETKVRLIDPDDVCAALEGTSQSAEDLAEDWEVPRHSDLGSRCPGRGGAVHHLRLVVPPERDGDRRRRTHLRGLP